MHAGYSLLAYRPRSHSAAILGFYQDKGVANIFE